MAVQHQQEWLEKPTFQFLLDQFPDSSIQLVAQKVACGRKTPRNGGHSQVDLRGFPTPVLQFGIVKGVDPSSLRAKGLYHSMNSVKEATFIINALSQYQFYESGTSVSFECVVRSLFARSNVVQIDASVSSGIASSSISTAAETIS